MYDLLTDRSQKALSFVQVVQGPFSQPEMEDLCRRAERIIPQRV